MAIYITGDIHGDIDLGKLKKEGFAAQEGDYVIICGDFGAVWNDSKEDKNLQEWYNSQPWTTLFCDGNHENFELLSKYPVEEWSGGKVHRIGPKILHLMRGQVFTIEDKKFFVMGGRAEASVTEEGSIEIATGIQSRAKGGFGSAIVLVERTTWNGHAYPLNNIKAAIVDGEKIKADTWYTLRNGEFVEA